MKVLFVLPNIAVGGVERVRLALIEYLSAHGIDCRLALRERRGELLDRACQLAPVDELAPDGLHQFVPSLVGLLKRERPTHVVTAFPDVGLLTWIALRLAGSRAKWVHTIDVTQDTEDASAKMLERLRLAIWRRVARFVNRRVDAVVAVSEGVWAELARGRSLDPRRIAMLYNPVVPDDKLEWRRPVGDGTCDCIRIVALGRLTHQKGFDVLVRAMANVQGPWQLAIWGDGAERIRLTNLVSELGLDDRISLNGYSADPFLAMRNADLFVMPSRYEGFGNVLVEALACQCQIVATDCPHGPREVLQDGRLGELVPVDDVGALAAAITRVASGTRKIDPERLLQRARDFTASKCCSQWGALLRRLGTD